jgi:membrane protein
MHVVRRAKQTPLPNATAPRVRLARESAGVMAMGITDRLHDLDRRQQEGPRIGFIAAVIKKFGDDQAGQLAALVAYYAFVSLFPLLLVLVTILGFVLQGDPSDQKKILDGALGQFPIVSDQLKLHSLTGSGIALAIGVIGSLLAGMGITGATQNAFNRIWNVPFKNRPNFLFAHLRGLGMLAILGTLSVVSTTAAGYVGSSSHGAVAVVAGVLVAFAFNLALFMTAFKLLTAVDVSFRDLLPGVIAAAVGWQLLQHLGGFYIDHTLKHTGPLYGVFALVLGLLAWLYLGAQLTIFAAEINVVRLHKLWPRSFFSDPLLEADRRALTSSAEVEERVEEQNVDVTFDEPA